MIYHKTIKPSMAVGLYSATRQDNWSFNLLVKCHQRLCIEPYNDKFVCVTNGTSLFSTISFEAMSNFYLKKKPMKIINKYIQAQYSVSHFIICFFSNSDFARSPFKLYVLSAFDGYQPESYAFTLYTSFVISSVSELTTATKVCLQIFFFPPFRNLVCDTTAKKAD